jgi:hypothetical protein
VGVSAHALVLPVEGEDDARLLPDWGVDGIETRTNFFKRKRFTQSEVKIFREAIVGKVAALNCAVPPLNARTGRRSDSAIAFKNQARQ